MTLIYAILKAWRGKTSAARFAETAAEFSLMFYAAALFVPNY